MSVVELDPPLFATFRSLFCMIVESTRVIVHVLLKDYWTSYLHKQLVGRQVVNATVNASSSAIRVYVHCANTE